MEKIMNFFNNVISFFLNIVSIGAFLVAIYFIINALDSYLKFHS
jgi:hypothetical protein